jgi:hypothetical protein
MMRPESAIGPLHWRFSPRATHQKYAQTVASTWIAPGCLQFWGEEKRFHTTWTQSGLADFRNRDLCMSLSIGSICPDVDLAPSNVSDWD